MSMEVQAKYMGGNETKGYMVNVRTAHPTGKIGDAGYIRYFDEKEAAKAYTKLVNTTGQDIYALQPKEEEPLSIRHKGDVLVKSADLEEKATGKECPPISYWRAAFSRLKDEDIETINETRKLPEGTKFVTNGIGGYSISNNIWGLTVGTRTLPEGFELKKNVLGFTVVLPKDSEGAFIKKAG